MACLLYNRVLWNAMPSCKAALRASPAPPALLPEELRLARLLSRLNTDLPIFSEHVGGLRLPRVAEIAMLPPVLTAAREQGVLPEGDFLTEALAAWCGPKQSALAPVVRAWWRTCRQSQFAWNVALQALDHALATAAFG